MAAGQQREWTLGALLEAAGVSACAPGGGLNPVIRRLSVDSRDVDAGTCFVALPGRAVDGHHFVPQALAAGAPAVLVQTGHFHDPCRTAVMVPDTHDAVARLAAVFYGVAAAQKAGQLTAVGVTGTNGKTTVCQLLRAILAAAGRRTACLSTVGNDLLGEAVASNMTTLPPIELCAQLGRAVSAGARCAVVEVSSHALDQRRCAGLRFDVGVFTNLTQDHLDYHDDMESYARAKRRLFDGLPASGTAVVGADDPHAEAMVSATPARILRYGLLADDLDVRAERMALDDDVTRFDLVLPTARVPVATRLFGRHNLRNILAAAGAAHALGVAPADIARGIESVTQVRGRLQRVPLDAPFSVFVDYAHTPDALSNVLAILRELTAGRLICVFGCGGDRDRRKRPLMAQAVGTVADVAIVTSDNPRSEDPADIIADTLAGFPPDAEPHKRTCVDRREAIGLALDLAAPGDVVLIAGKGHEDYQIIGTQRLPFDDVAVVAGLMAERAVPDVKRKAS